MKIKFRVWDKITEHMIRSPYDAPFNIVIMLPGGVQIHEKSLEQKFIEADCGVDDKRFNCMLYTGIDDKNDKEIYEADIIKTRFGTGYVVYNLGRFLVNDYKIQLNHCISFDVEILGNIYENEDLKKKYVDVPELKLRKEYKK